MHLFRRSLESRCNYASNIGRITLETHVTFPFVSSPLMVIYYHGRDTWFLNLYSLYYNIIMLLPFSWHEISWNFCRMLRVGCCVKNNHARGLKIFIQCLTIRVYYYCTLRDSLDRIIHYQQRYIYIATYTPVNKCRDTCWFRILI